jgi:hypothetical protein
MGWGGLERFPSQFTVAKTCQVFPRIEEAFMNLTRKTYSTRSEKIIDFIVGFIGWFVLNGVMGGASSLAFNLLSATPLPSDPNFQTALGILSLVLTCLPLLVNVGLIVFFAFTRYWIALGMLGALAAALIVVICIAVLIGGACLALIAGYSSMSTP